MDNAKILAGLLIVLVTFSGCIQTFDGETTTTTVPSGETTITTIMPSGEVAGKGDVVCLDYIGRFENGTVFDTSIESEAEDAGIYQEGRLYEPLCFEIGSGMVIDGFDEGVRGMAVGETKEITVPPEKGYSSGSMAGKTLIFEVTLVEIKEITLEMTVLNDERCDECDISGLVMQLEMAIPGINVKEIDYGTEEGKKLYDDLELEYLPAILFDDSVESVDGYESVKGYLEKAGDYYSLRIGASFDPTLEICDNGVDDNGDELVDCDDSDCEYSLVCNKDALVECSEPYGLTENAIIFYHSEQCGWCAKMKPYVENLQKEGYEFHWAEVSDADAVEVVDSCFRDYMTSTAVPQFMCVKSGEIQVGAFASEDELRDFADDCIGE